MKRYIQGYKNIEIIFTGILLIISGMFILGLDMLEYKEIVTLIMTLLLFVNIYKVNKDKDKVRQIIINIIILIISLSIPVIPLSFLPLVFGVYFLMNAIIRLINAILYFKNNISDKYTELFMVLFYLVFSIPILFTPLKKIQLVFITIGIYFILLGISLFKQLIPNKQKDKLKRKIRVTLPVFLELIIPYKILKDINIFLSNNSLNDDNIILKKQNKDNVDLEIFVHVAPSKVNRIGHVDIFFEDEVISYGNYNDTSRKYKEMIGDGVLFITTNKKSYINFSIEHMNKTIFGFGLTLSKKEKDAIRNKIDEIKKNLYAWNPNNNNTEFSKLLYEKTKADFYKFKSGKFKTYFVGGTNCCLLADEIVGKCGIDIIKMNGIITPGAYYEYLNYEFNKKNSNVINKTLYHEVSVKEDKIKLF